MGPLVNSGVLLVEALPECVADACDVDAREDMIQFVRQVTVAFHVHASTAATLRVLPWTPGRRTCSRSAVQERLLAGCAVCV